MNTHSLSLKEIDALRARLRDIAALIARQEARHGELRQLQLDQIGIALRHGANVSQAARESGLSRYWLLQAVPRLPQKPEVAPDPAIRDGAIARIREIRTELETVIAPALLEGRADRDEIIRTLAPAMGRSRLPQQDVAADAGISSEWIRRLLKEQPKD